MHAKRREIALFLALMLLMAHVPQNRAWGQASTADVASRIAMVSRDSLMRYVAELSGEDSIFVSGPALVVRSTGENVVDSTWVTESFVRLPNRVEWANDAATEYLVRRLRSFGYDSVVVDSYPSNDKYPATKNVLAYKSDAGPQQPVWLLGAHYDSVIQAPGADDNASGTAVVLECARVLSDANLNSNLIFALWDTEEAGLIGSELFAAKAEEAGWQIDGVMNVDMVGWDGDLDGYVEIHADSAARWMAEYTRGVLSTYGMGINIYIATPGVGRSDHVSFRRHGYPALMVIQEMGEDFDPHYHSPGDTLGNFNTTFFFETAKTVIGTMAALSLSGTSLATQEDFLDSQPEFAAYPNPVSDVLVMEFKSKLEATARIVVTDVLGRVASDIDVGGKTRVRWTVPAWFAPGLYFFHLVGNSVNVVRPIVVG